MLTISATIAGQLCDHALLCYPAECCGLLFAPAGTETATRAVPMDNVQDRLHAIDPVANPRTSRNGFEMNVLKAARELESARAQGERLVAVYHSHVDCDAYFSDRDVAAAAPPPAHAPHDPSLWHVVLSCWPDGVRHARAFCWDGRGFIPYQLDGFTTVMPASVEL